MRFLRNVTLRPLGEAASALGILLAVFVAFLFVIAGVAALAMLLNTAFR